MAAITAARSHVEGATRRVLIEQTWRLYLDRWPRGRTLRLPVVPLIAVDAIRVRAGDGPILLDDADFAVDAASAPSRLTITGDAPSPVGRALNGIEIDVTAGYGETAAAVPSPLRHAVMMLVAHWYEQRSAVGEARISETVPLGFAALIAPYRVMSL